MRLQRRAALALLFREKARSARLPRASRCGELRNSRNYATGIIAPLLSWLPARCLPSGARLRPLVNALATARCRYHFFAGAIRYVSACRRTLVQPTAPRSSSDDKSALFDRLV